MEWQDAAREGQRRLLLPPDLGTGHGRRQLYARLGAEPVGGEHEGRPGLRPGLGTRPAGEAGLAMPRGRQQGPIAGDWRPALQRRRRPTATLERGLPPEPGIVGAGDAQSPGEVRPQLREGEDAERRGTRDRRGRPL